MATLQPSRTPWHLWVVGVLSLLWNCYGGYDYLMKFVTAGIVEYQTIMERLIDMDIGIDKYFSFVVLKSPIVKAHLPLDVMFTE